MRPTPDQARREPDTESRRIGALLTRLVGPSDIMVSLADLRLPDHPLVYVNSAFCRATGYAAGEVIGRNCRFLQGPGTDPAQIAIIRDAVTAGRSAEVELVNHRKDGSAFVNLLRLSPVLGEDGAPEYMLGSQLDVTADREREAATRAHARQTARRMLDMLQTVRSMVSMSARAGRGGDDGAGPRIAAAIGSRIDAIGAAHRAGDASGDADLRALVEAVLSCHIALPHPAVEIEGPALPVPQEAAPVLALILGELAANALRHGALRGAEGRLEVSWSRAGPDGGALDLVWCETLGAMGPGPSRAPGGGAGLTMIDGIAAHHGGRAARDWRAGLGLRMRLELPLGA